MYFFLPGSGVGDLMELVSLLVGWEEEHLLTWRRAAAGDLVDTVLGTPAQSSLSLSRDGVA